MNSKQKVNDRTLQYISQQHISFKNETANKFLITSIRRIDKYQQGAYITK